MPTVLFAGVVAVLALLLLAVRMLLASSAPASATGGAQPAQVEQVAMAPQVREPLGAPLPNTNPAPTTTIKFASRPIEPSYTVLANDNLWAIAQRNRTTAEAIQAINNLPERATLSIGQRLVMP